MKTVGRGMNPVRWFSSNSDSDPGQNSEQDKDGSKLPRRVPIDTNKEKP